jgi:hypothetical protein
VFHETARRRADDIFAEQRHMTSSLLQCAVPRSKTSVYLQRMIVLLLLLTYLLQLSFHSVAVVLTLVQTKQIMYINETIQKHSTNNIKHSKYKYTYYQNTNTYTHPHFTESTHMQR